MDGKEREDRDGEGRERERTKKMSNVGRGCHKYPIANGRNNLCKIKARKKKNGSIK
jgi:hypothetical protein